MDKKRFLKTADTEDLKGFEEFIEGQSSDTNFLPKGVGGTNKKNESGFEHFTFLTNDSERLTKVKDLLSEKLPFSSRFDQRETLIKDQQEELLLLRKKLFDIFEKEDSAYLKSLGEIFNSFFEPPKP